MIIYIQSIEYDLWLSIENGPYRPIKTKNGISITKARNEYTDDDENLFSMDAKAMNILYCVLSISKVNRIRSCKNTRDIWHALEI
jgi:hypothetical protein